MGTTIIDFTRYKQKLNEIIVDPLVMAECYGNHVDELRLTTDRQRELIVRRHLTQRRGKAADDTRTVVRPCIICSTAIRVMACCPEDRVLCDKCVLLADLD